MDGGDSVPDPLRRTVSQHQIGSTTVTATLPGVGNTRSVSIFIVRITLDVDADRDGIVEENAEGKEAWAWGGGMAGATLLCNNDNDNRSVGNTTIDKDNSVVDGSEDINDLASLIVRQTGALPPGLSLFLSVADQSKIRIFDNKNTSSTAIIGPSPLPAEFQLIGANTTNLELGCEGIEYPTSPSSSYDGIIDLSLILRKGTTEYARDNVQMRVAPWLMLSHLHETEEVYVVETSDNASFVSTLDSILTPLSIPLRRTSNTDRWMQDTMEIGYSRTAGQEFNVILKAVRRRGLRDYARDNLLGRNYGYVEVASSTSANTFDSHGNLEVSPPVQVGGSNYQLGRIYYGSGRHSQPFNTEMEAFLQAQLVQKPFAIDTGWLAVGHVDEVISFVPTSLGSKGFKMLIADTNEAINLFTFLRSAGHGSLKLFESKTEEITINNLLTELGQTSTGSLGWANNFCQSRLDGVRSVMATKLGLEASDIITIPSLFVENPRSPRRIIAHEAPVFDALIPGMINMLVITKPSIADSHLVVARPFGPVLGGIDQLEQVFRGKLAPSGFTATQIHFIDDYETYHLQLGEVHCGTNSKRKPGTLPWWEQTDF